MVHGEAVCCPCSETTPSKHFLMNAKVKSREKQVTSVGINFEKWLHNRKQELFSNVESHSCQQ